MSLCYENCLFTRGTSNSHHDETHFTAQLNGRSNSQSLWQTRAPTHLQHSPSKAVPWSSLSWSSNCWTPAPSLTYDCRPLPHFCCLYFPCASRISTYAVSLKLVQEDPARLSSSIPEVSCSFSLAGVHGICPILWSPQAWVQCLAYHYSRNIFHKDIK